MPLFGLEPILCPGLSLRCRLCQYNVCPAFFVSRCNPKIWWSSVALYGLILFYGLTKDELKDRRPLAKFLAIKLIVFFTFYQAFLVSCESARDITLSSKFPAVLRAGRTCDPWFVRCQSSRSPTKSLPATKYWTEANIADGLTALATCVEASSQILFLLPH